MYSKRSFAIPVAASRSARNATAITWLVDVHLVAGGVDGCLLGCHVAMHCVSSSIFDNSFLCSTVPLWSQIERAQRSSSRWWLQQLWIMSNRITSPSMSKIWKSLQPLTVTTTYSTQQTHERAGAHAFARQLFERTKDTYSSSYIEGASVILSPGKPWTLDSQGDGRGRPFYCTIHLYFNNAMGITCNIVNEVHLPMIPATYPR